MKERAWFTKDPIKAYTHRFIFIDMELILSTNSQFQYHTAAQ